MTHDYYILVGREIRKAKGVLEWGAWFEKADRIIKQETTPLGYWVSTVFLGTDYNFSDEGEPILFETMVFNKKNKANGELDMNRYRSYAEAELGHTLMVVKWSSKWQVFKHKIGGWWDYRKIRMNYRWERIKAKFRRKKK